MGIEYSWHFPCDKQLILKFVFPHYSSVTTIFLTWFKLRPASAQPLCPFILSVIHPYQCALVNGKSGFASAQNAPIRSRVYMREVQIPWSIRRWYMHRFLLTFFVHMDRARVKLQAMRDCTNTTQLAIKEKCYNWLIRICFSGVLTGASLFVQCLTSLNCLKNKMI